MRSGKLWRLWLILGLLAFACGHVLPGLILEMVIFPQAKDTQPGLRVDSFAHTRQNGRQLAQQRLPGASRIAPGPEAKSFRAYTVINPTKSGRADLRLDCPQTARLFLDSSLVLSVGGINRAAKTFGRVDLAQGPCLLVLEANGPAKLELKLPGQERFKPLSEQACSYPELGNLGSWWLVLRLLASAPYLALAFWVLAALGFLLGSPLPRRDGPFSAKAVSLRSALVKPGWLALLLGLFLLSLYILTMSGHFHSFDDTLRFKTTQALAQHGQLTIDAYDDGKSGHAKYGPVQPALAVPLYWLGDLLQKVWPEEPKLPEVAVSTLMQFVTAVSAAAMFGVLLGLGYGPAASAGAALLFGLASMAWPYARHHFTGPLTGLFLLGAWWFILCAGRGRSVLKLALAGFCLGLAGLNSANVFILACPLFLAYAAWIFRPGVGRLFHRAWNWLRALFALALPMALGAAAYLGFNALRYGSPWVTGYEIDRAAPNLVYDGCNGFCNPWWVGVYGLLFSPGKSVFLYSPLLVASALLLRRFHKRHPAETLLLAGFWLGWLAFYATWWAWHGDFCWGPRYLLPVMGLACLPLAEAWRRWGRWGRVFKVSFICLAGVALGVQILAITLPFSYYLTSLVPNDLSNIYLVHYVPHFSPLLGQFKMLARADHLDFYWLDRPAWPWLVLVCFSLGTLLWHALRLARKNG